MEEHPIDTHTDEALALQVQAGDSEAYGTLIERYEAKLLRYGRKFLAGQEDIQDIVQEVFVSGYENIQSFDATRRFSPWIYRIAHNSFVNALRKRSRQPVSFFGFDFDTFVPHPVFSDPRDDERDQEEMKVLVEAGLAKVAPQHAEVLILRYLEELSYKDIADVLHIPIGTVSVRVKRAKVALKKTYETLNIHGT
jgi:RNA polymerase sigma-70 factor (ECF subfamily)